MIGACHGYFVLFNGDRCECLLCIVCVLSALLLSAGIIGSQPFGVAKSAMIVAVKVFNDTDQTTDSYVDKFSFRRPERACMAGPVL